MIVAPPEREQADLAGLLDQGLQELGLRIDEEVRRKLVRYLRLLDKWNEAYNLTAIRDIRKAVGIHLLDSIAVAPYISRGRLLDVGTGAGLPGIPLAMTEPDLSVTLLDSNHKKAAFLTEAIGVLGLKNARVICQRVESWRPEERFDCIISRAFSEIPEFVALSRHLLAPKGVLAAMKGLLPYEEIERLPPEFRVRHLHRLSVPSLAASRHLVLIERA